MQNQTSSIVRLFPGSEEKIDFLFQSDENFRDLCTDYLLCASLVLDKKSAQNKNAEEIADLEEIQRELECDIRKEIEKKRSI